MTYVVKKTVRDVGGAQYPLLTRTNYAEWVVLMKVMLKARRLWAAVTVGTADEEDDKLAMEAILKSKRQSRSAMARPSRTSRYGSHLW